MYFPGIEVLNLMECFNSIIYLCSKFTFFITQSYQYLEKKSFARKTDVSSVQQQKQKIPKASKSW